MDYKTKYLKYKNKYLNLKKQFGSGNQQSSINNQQSSLDEKKSSDNTCIICLLWYNKELGPIQQFSKGVDLQIKANILRTYKMFKEKYSNPDVVLFLNFDKIIPEDFEFFSSNNIVIEDVNKFEVIKKNEHLKQLFIDNPSEYTRKVCPVYIYVDMLKILIQYEQMVTYGYNYVIFSDIDIQDGIERESIKDRNDIICKMLDLITEFTQTNLLNQRTIELLDNFGYLMAGFARYQDMSETDISIYNNLYPKYPNEFEDYMKIGSEIKKLVFASGENSFLISANTPNVIKAIKDYFIDYVFNYLIFDYPDRDNNYIYLCYEYFYNYLNFLNANTFIRFQEDLSKPSLDKFKINIDYSIVKDEDAWWNPSIKLRIVQVLTDKLCLFLIKTKSNNLESFLTPKGKIILENFKYNIFPIIQKTKYDNKIGTVHSNKDSTLIPFICVPVDRQKNSSL